METTIKNVAERYKKLLQPVRFRPSEGNRKQTVAGEAASDRGRILFSNAFRRLQSKTQVFDQEWNASVRTRLTHSLEVASVGRYISEITVRDMLKKEWLGPTSEVETLDVAAAITTVVEVACLMHDLGNPPFGHFGESTIQTWFRTRKDKFHKQFPNASNAEFNKIYRDFEYFDGNPQGFRIATKLQWIRDEFGYNLTYTQLAAMLKYPWTTEKVGTQRDGRNIKKAGVFLSEAEELKRIHTELGLGDGARHPLAYLMEAADDISYCLSDIEDALEKKIIRGQDFVHWVRERLSADDGQLAQKILASLPENADVTPENRSKLAWYVGFRTTATNELVAEASRLFIENHDLVLAGNYFDLLDKSTGAHKLLKAIKDFSEEYLYPCSVIRERELVGFEVLTGILDRFGLLLNLPSDDAYKVLTRQEVTLAPEYLIAPTLQSFLAPKQLLAYKHAVDASRNTTSDENERSLLEWYARAHLLTDFVSGMTDDHAIVTFQRLYSGGLRHI